MMWGVKVTVVKAMSLTEERFEHDVGIDKADFVLVFNELNQCGHYSAVSE